MSSPRHFAALACAALAAAWMPSASASSFQGLWCGTGLLSEFTLKIAPGSGRGQVEGSLARRGRVREVAGNVEGSLLRTQATRHGSLVLTAIGSELRIVGGEGALALASGGTFKRAQGERCGL